MIDEQPIQTKAEEIIWAENYDLKHIFTPVDGEKLEQMLIESGYDDKKRNFVVDGFKHSFSLQYHGDQRVKRLSPNLKLGVGSPVELWNKVMKEVQAKRYAGPFIWVFHTVPNWSHYKGQGKENTSDIPSVLSKKREISFS